MLHSAASSSTELPAFGIIFTLSTGVHLGELIGFQWGDINVKNHSIRVRRTVGRLQKVDEDGNLIAKESGKASTEIVIRFPKSITSQREIPLFDELWDGLMEYRSRQSEMFMPLALTSTEVPIFFACLPARFMIPEPMRIISSGH